jgi:hypothetical protein
VSDELQRIWKELSCPDPSAVLEFSRRNRGNTRKPVTMSGVVEEIGIETFPVMSPDRNYKVIPFGGIIIDKDVVVGRPVTM